MSGRRILWCALILLTAAVYVFHNDTGTRILLCAVILIPVLAALVALLPGKRVTVEPSLRPVPGKDTFRDAVIRVTNGSVVPLMNGEVRTRIENSFTGESVALEQAVAVPGRKSAEPVSRIDSACCGQIRWILEDWRRYDPFRMFCRTTPLRLQKSYMILPSYYPMQVIVTQRTEQIRDGEQYSMVHAGNDPGETFQIREYRPGDPIRRIHWKLTEKSDRVMVRDFGLPVENEILLLAETSLDPEILPDPRQLHEMMSCLYSMAFALIRQEYAVSVGWRNQQTGLFQMAEIQQDRELSAAVTEILTQGVRTNGDNVVTAFLSEHVVCNYSHVAVIALQKEPDCVRLLNGNRVTLFRIGGDAPGRSEEEEVKTVMISAEELRSGCLLAEL